MVSIQIEIRTRSERDTNLHRPWRDETGSNPVYTRIILIGVPGVLKHLKNEIHTWKSRSAWVLVINVRRCSRADSGDKSTTFDWRARLLLKSWKTWYWHDSEVALQSLWPYHRRHQQQNLKFKQKGSPHVVGRKKKCRNRIYNQCLSVLASLRHLLCVASGNGENSRVDESDGSTEPKCSKTSWVGIGRSHNMRRSAPKIRKVGCP